MDAAMVAKVRDLKAEYEKTLVLPLGTHRLRVPLDPKGLKSGGYILRLTASAEGVSRVVTIPIRVISSGGKSLIESVTTK